MKRVILLISIFLFYQNVIAQFPFNSKTYEPPKSLLETTSFLSKDSMVFYYNYKYEIVKVECAEIFRFTKVDSISAKFTGKFLDFRYDSILIIEGFHVNGVKDGLFKKYYLSGKIKESGLYKNDKKVGIWEYWYENGTIKQHIDFSNENPKLIDFWDENGKKSVNNGEGYYKINTNTSLNGPSTLEGKIVYGYKEGKWKLITSESLSYSETYTSGNLVKGIHSYLYGKEEYTDKTFCNLLEEDYIDNSENYIVGNCYYNNNYGFGKITSPEFKGGDIGFRSYIANKLQYPEKAAERGIQGRVVVQFVIEEDGRLSNFTIARSVDPELDKEAIRVIKSSPKWKPGMIKGKPIRVSYTFPVTFILE